MLDYDPAVDGIGIEQLNIGLQEKLNECFEHIDQQGTEANLKQEIANLKAQVNLLIKVVYALATDQVMNQEDLNRLINLKFAIQES